LGIDVEDVENGCLWDPDSDNTHQLMEKVLPPL